MKKKYVLITIMILAIGMTACSMKEKEKVNTAGITNERNKLEASKGENAKLEELEITKEETAKQETIEQETTEQEMVRPEITESKKAELETIKTELETKIETSETEITDGDPIIGIVDRYENNIIVIRDGSDEDIICYFSTQNAQIIEGDSPITVGDIVEITYKGVEGDEEHPGMAVKIVAESMIYNTERNNK